jgi:streptogramin lyase
MSRVDPRTLQNTLKSNALPAEEGQYAVGYGSVWRHDVPSGTLMRFDPATADLDALVRLLPARERASVYVTSIAAGAGGIWVTLSQS